MYYESIPQKITPVADTAKATTKIKESKAHVNEALCWENSHGKFYMVSDFHIDDCPFAETAVLQEITSEFFQLESITAAWIDTAQELAECFDNSITEPVIKRKIQLITGGPTNQMDYFECGCCGKSFKAIVAKQLKFVQDIGYGICSDFENLH